MKNSIEGYLTPAEVADATGLSKPTIYKHLGSINGVVNVNGRYIIPEKALNEKPLKAIAPKGKHERPKNEGDKLFSDIRYIARRNDQAVLIEIDRFKAAGCSYQEISDYFNVSGIAAPRGGYWSKQLVFNYERAYEL